MVRGFPLFRLLCHPVPGYVAAAAAGLMLCFTMTLLALAINVSMFHATGMGVSALVQLPAGDAQAQRLAGAMQQPLPGSPQQQPQPGLQVAVGNAKMMRDAQVDVPPSAETVLRELEVSIC